MTATIFELPTLPPALPAFARAALSASKRNQPEADIPPIEAHVGRVVVDPANLAAFNKLCGFPERLTLPMTYPQVLATIVQMHLMTQKLFPLPLLGLVHLRNDIHQVRPIRVDEVLDLRVRTAGGRDIALGIEFDLVTECTDTDGIVIWSAVTTILHRVPGKVSRHRAPSPAPEVPLSQYVEIRAPEDTGRRYAAISKDYNPIHLHALTAKLFGFKRAIATGFWTASRCLAELEPRLKGDDATRYAFQFRQPLLLPGRAALRFEPGSEQVDFALVGADGGRIHLTGTLR